MAKHIVKTTCTMDCPDTCALEVTVVDGKVAKINGAANGHPNTQGYICTKVARFPKRLYYKERLLYPMRRIGPKGSGKYQRISWDTAIAAIADRFKAISLKHGSEAILPYHYGGSNGLLGDEFMDHYYFARLGASRCQKTLCAAPTTAVNIGMYGKMPGVAFEEYPKAKFILIWGANPKASNIHLVPYLKEARKNGAFIAVVDPSANFSANEVDLHIPVYPGSDLPLALGMIHYWMKKGLLADAFLADHAVNLQPLLDAARKWPVARAAEAARVPATRIEKLAEAYAELSPAVLRCGWGLERNRNGGQAAAAILAMPALLGKFGEEAGGFTMSNSGAGRFDRDKVLGEIEWNSRLLNQTRLADFLVDPLDPPIKALFVYNCNPVATVPHQNKLIKGLRRDDLFTVVFEQVMTDSCHYADILLPAVTFLEQQEIRKAYGSYVTGGVQPVIEPMGEAKPNEEVFAMLGRAMGWEDDPFSWTTGKFMKKVAGALTLGEDKGDVDLLMAGRIQKYGFEGAPPVQFKTVFPRTPDEKINLTPEALGDKPYHFQAVKDKKYPLAMISPATNKMVSSTFGEFNYPTLFVTINPADAEPRRINSGDKVRVFNELGEVVCKAKVKRAIRSGVVCMPKGAWRKASLNGKTSTALCPTDTNVVAGGACYNDARVQIEKAK